MRLLATLAVAVILAGCTPAEAAYEDVFEAAKGAAWAIYVRDTGGMKAVCSASAYKTDDKETQLVTAGHCFIGTDVSKTDFLVTQDHRTFHKAHLVENGLKPKKETNETSSSMSDYKGDDWAIIKADVGNMPVLPLGKADDLRAGEDILMVGVPFGLDFLAVQGIVGSKDVSMSQLIWNHYFGANIYVAGGNSGGGVISTKQKAIIGIVNAGPGAQSSMMIFMPIEKLPGRVR